MANIVETAVDAGTFKTLVAAVKAAGLAETLSGPGPFTVFAPTDQAFAKLPAGTVDALLADLPRLTKILKFHVVPGKVMSSSLKNGQTAATVEGQSVSFDMSHGAKVNGASITKADINTDNGVIHVIDTVIMPS